MISVKKEQGTQKVGINLPVKITTATQFFKQGYEFPIARLVNVHYNPEKPIKRNGLEELTPALGFTFIDAANKEKTNTFYQYPIASTDAKYKEREQWQGSAIKHIFDETVGEDKFKEEDFKGDTFEEFYAKVVETFNKYQIPSKTEGKTIPLYSKTPVYLKQTLYKNRPGLPLFPNFVQAAYKENKQVECELKINPAQESVTMEEKVKTSNIMGSESEYGFGDISGDLPSFGAGY